MTNVSSFSNTRTEISPTSMLSWPTKLVPHDLKQMGQCISWTCLLAESFLCFPLKLSKVGDIHADFWMCYPLKLSKVGDIHDYPCRFLMDTLYSASLLCSCLRIPLSWLDQVLTALKHHVFLGQLPIVSMGSSGPYGMEALYHRKPMFWEQVPLHSP